MSSKDIFNIIEKLPLYWEKRTGVLIVFVISLIIYLSYLQGFITYKPINIWWFKLVLTPLIIFIIIWIAWYISTSRFCYKKNSSKISIGVFINVDENESAKTIKKIIRGSINEITDEFNEIKIVLYPINYKTSINSIEKYLKTRNFCLDTIVFAKVESGNITNKLNDNVEHKISIKEITFSGNFNMKENLRVFKDNINMIRDLSISHHFKDWNYIEQNSYNDKNKIKTNFKETLLHYSGLYLIYMKEEKLSLKIFKKLHNPENSQVRIKKGDKIKLTSEQLASARNNGILLNLFMQTAFKYYIDGNMKFTYETLKECETYFNKHSDSFNHYINLARFAYSNDLIGEAISYNEKALSHYGLRPEVIVNKIFFAIIEHNVKDFINYIRKLNSKFLNKTHINFVDIVGFLENEKDKHPKSQKMFDFAIGYYYIFIDKNEAKNILSKYTNINSGLEGLSTLSIELLNMTKTKHIKSKRKKKRKKKKKVR